MMVRELPGRSAVNDVDRQLHKTARLHLLFQVIGCGKSVGGRAVNLKFDI